MDKRRGTNIGRKFSKVWIQRLSESHKRYFQEHPEACRKSSEILLKLWRTPSWRAKQMKSRGGRSLRVKMARYWHLYIPTHHRSNSVGYVPEHIVLAEKKIGRLLRKGEIVHHMDGDRWNNHPDNLIVMTHSLHSSHHAKETGFGTNNHLYTKSKKALRDHMNSLHERFDIGKWAKQHAQLAKLDHVVPFPGPEVVFTRHR